MKDFHEDFPMGYIFGEGRREFEGAVLNLGREGDL